MRRAVRRDLEARAMKLIIGLVIIVALAYLGYRIFFVNARRR